MVLVYQTYARERGTQYFRLGLNLESDLGNDSDFQPRPQPRLVSRQQVGRRAAQRGPGRRHDPARHRVLPAARPARLVLRGCRSRGTSAPTSMSGRAASTSRATCVERTLTGMFLGLNVEQLRATARRDRLPRRRGAAPRSGTPTYSTASASTAGSTSWSSSTTRSTTSNFPTTAAMRSSQSLFVREELGFPDSYETVSAQRRHLSHLAQEHVRARLQVRDTLRRRRTASKPLNTLGGFLNLSGFERNSITGEHVGLARLTRLSPRRVPAVFAWEFPVYVGGFVEFGNAWDDRGDIDDDLLFSARPVRGRRYAARSALHRLRLRRGRRAAGLHLPRPEF